MSKPKRKKTTRKKRTLTPEQLHALRSKRARKGWRTRRKSDLNKTLKNVKRKIKFGTEHGLIPELGPTPKPKGKRKTRAELEEEIRELKHFLTFVPVDEPDMIRADGSLALYKSYMRTLPEPERSAIWDQLHEARNRANETGLDFWLHQQCVYWASHFDIPVREVYAFLWSP